MMPFSHLKQVNVMFGKKQRNGDVTRQRQDGIAQKRVWILGGFQAAGLEVVWEAGILLLEKLLLLH